MPLYPSFIALLPITPPGLSLIGPTPALGILSCVGLLTVFVARELWVTYGRGLFADRFVRAMGVYLASMAIASVLGFVRSSARCFVSLRYAHASVRRRFACGETIHVSRDTWR